MDLALAELLAGSPAWRFLNGVADVLDNHPFLTVTEPLVTEALNLAGAHTLGALLPSVASRASEDAMDELPEFAPGDLAGSYANRIRAAAEDLR
jgi:hypothetical protein